MKALGVELSQVSQKVFVNDFVPTHGVRVKIAKLELNCVEVERTLTGVLYVCDARFLA